MAQDNLSKALFELKDRQRRQGRRTGARRGQSTRGAASAGREPPPPYRPRAFDPVFVLAAFVLGCSLLLQVAVMLRHAPLN